MRAPTETEFKLKSLANIQLKFTPLDTADLLRSKLGILCDLLDISLGPPTEEQILDEYFDDEKRTLWSHRCSFRRRESKKKHRVTLKVHSKSPIEGALHRIEDEFDCSDDDFEELTVTPERLARHIGENLGLSVTLGNIESVISIQNRRISLPLATDLAEYRFCYDKYYYFNRQEGRYSEYFAEIEIELEAGEIPHDPQLAKLRDALSRLLNYTPNDTTKLQRGMSWAQGEGQTLDTIYAVAFDVIGYTQRTADVQKQVILTFNRHTKEAIREFRGKACGEDVIYIPTGDGMILVFDGQPETLLPIVFSIQERVKQHRNLVGPEQHFSFRTGLHAGPVFKYSDVNENLNFAGNGINLAARVMALGDEWHILASEAGYEAFGKTSSVLDRSFALMGQYQIKHGQTLTVYNVVDRDRQCGNPARPRG